MLQQVQFRGIKSLLDVTVDLAPFTVLVGPNGCGKSTLLDQIEVLGVASRPRSPGGGTLGPVGEVLGRLGPANLRTRGASSELAWIGRGEATCRLEVTVAGDQVANWVAATRLQARVGNRKAAIAQGHQDNDAWNQLVTEWFTWSAQRLALVPREVAAPSEVDLASLRPDGYGLPTVLKDFASDHTRLYLAMQADLASVVPHFRELRLGKSSRAGVPPAGGVVPLHTLEFEMRQGRIPANQVSDGTLLAVALLTVVHNPDLPKIVLIDDIDHGLHLGAQYEMVKAIRAVQKVRPELQVICTTHSPVLLDSFDVSEVRVMALDTAGHSQVKPLAAHPKLDGWREGLSSGELWANLGEEWVADG